MEKTIDELLEAPYWVVDILPKQVPKDSPGQYFAVEAFYRQKKRMAALLEKRLGVLLRLNCYCDLTLADTKETNPPPARLAARIAKERLCLTTGNAMIVSEPDDTRMTVYGPDEALLALLKPLAEAEGLFLWQPPQ